MNWSTKITAGALQFVLFIGVVIALLLLSFVTLAHTNQLFGKKTELFVNTIKKADLGLEYILKNTIRTNDSVNISLSFEDEISTKATRNYWGVYEKYSVTAQSKKNSFTKVVLAGNHTTETRPALYLQDNQRPMIIVGKAEIKGNAYLPKQGIRPGNIAGNSFYGTALVRGRQLQSSERLPRLDTGFTAYVQSIFHNRNNTDYEPISLEPGMNIQNSFKSTAKLLQGEVLNLSELTLSGHIIVKASRRIVVDRSANLRDVVLIAPEIIIKDGVSGIFQAIASKRIDLGKRCELGYPSALVVIDKTKVPEGRPTIQRPELHIGAGSLLKGIVLYMTTEVERPTFHPQVKIEEKAVVWGEVYCQRNLEHKGKVFGNIATYGFIALENGSIYQNHLFNGTVDSEGLPAAYSGLPLVGKAISKTSAKWLY